MAFGMSTVELRTGMWFLFGRAVGLIILGLLIVFAGMFLGLSPKLMQGIAGVLAVGFGFLLIGQNITTKSKHENRNTNCQKTHSHDNKHKHHGPGCKKHKSKPCNETESSPTPCIDTSLDTHTDNANRNQIPHHTNELALNGGGQHKRKAFGFGMGLLRGVTPCFKIAILAPLLVSVTIASALGMVIVFTTVSMIYPLIGYLSASTLHNIVQNRKLMLMAGAALLIVIGSYYIYESFQATGVHIPGTGGI
jgi:ABC-type nickel/cobalt efflux system permease component RcnA